MLLGTVNRKIFNILLRITNDSQLHAVINRKHLFIFTISPPLQTYEDAIFLQYNASH
jgi:hypothetical protein